MQIRVKIEKKNIQISADTDIRITSKVNIRSISDGHSYLVGRAVVILITHLFSTHFLSMKSVTGPVYSVLTKHDCNMIAQRYDSFARSLPLDVLA